MPEENKQKLVRRSQKVAFMNIGDAEVPNYQRMKKFTELSNSRNSIEYSRQYVDEDGEDTDVVGVSLEKGFAFDEYANNQEEGQTLLDKLSSNVDEANMVINKITIMQLINKLKSREKQIILLRYYKGKTQTEIAKILGITQVQISRIEKKILNDMKRNLTENILTG